MYLKRVLWLLNLLLHGIVTLLRSELDLILLVNLMHWQVKCLEDGKELEDNVLKSWTEESPHPYENDASVTKVGCKFSWSSW